LPVDGSLNGHVALITGGGRGIGRAVAEALAGAGATVALAGRTEEVLAEAAEAIGRGATAHRCDVSSVEDVEHTVREVLERHGRIDVLVNNAAAAGNAAAIQDVDPADWDETMATNARGAFLCTRTVAPHMLERGSGVILYISALGGIQAFPYRSAYSASKAAMLALMRTAAAELGPQGIRVAAISPGPVRGERLERSFAARAAAAGVTPEDVERATASAILTRRIAEPEEVAQVALFLCGPHADMLIGQSLNMTGGLEILQP
jgi:NAD(P)-dependent dehydrogenase (short-subunit alcohol dehydrogenase family)